MLKPTILCFLIFLTSPGLAQIEAVPGTLNQIENDPAQKGFEKEYDDLQKTIDDLDRPVEKQSEETRESKLPSNKVNTDFKKW
jgi:peptidoglycan hydrolase CwlO-like protein